MRKIPQVEIVLIVDGRSVVILEDNYRTKKWFCGSKRSTMW